MALWPSAATAARVGDAATTTAATRLSLSILNRDPAIAPGFLFSTPAMRTMAARY
ncbi:MAG: hypothetical protein ABF504_10190 [Komagataeibacter saccharivorans]|uniref:hypothetical protein n=1 Tax=Komagataeibacter saccharivorans TaxID=265959 RepID=UPI0039EACFDF